MNNSITMNMFVQNIFYTIIEINRKVGNRQTSYKFIDGQYFDTHHVGITQHVNVLFNLIKKQSTQSYWTYLLWKEEMEKILSP